MILANQAAGGVAGMVLWIVILIAFMYFFMIRPQQKRAKQEREMREKLARGAKVVTAGGIHGTISEVAEDYFIIEVAKGVNIRVNKTSVYEQVDEKDKEKK